MRRFYKLPSLLIGIELRLASAAIIVICLWIGFLFVIMESSGLYE